MSTLHITWNNPESRGWTDIIPLSIFNTVEVRGFQHDCVKGSSVLNCGATAFIFDCLAVVDYARDQREANEEAGVYIGQTILVFADSSRRKVVSVLWRDEDGGDVWDLTPLIEIQSSS